MMVCLCSVSRFGDGFYCLCGGGFEKDLLDLVVGIALVGGGESGVDVFDGSSGFVVERRFVGGRGSGSKRGLMDLAET